MADVELRPATPADIETIARIYALAAADTWATFDLEGHSVERWYELLAESDPARGHHLIVACDRESGSVIGYARSGRHKEKAAYDTTCETSIYVDSAVRRSGIGGALYDELLRLLDQGPLRLAVAGVALPNSGSVRLHESRGFTSVGVFEEVGVKLGRVWDVQWFQRKLARPAPPG